MNGEGRAHVHHTSFLPFCRIDLKPACVMRPLMAQRQEMFMRSTVFPDESRRNAVRQERVRSCDSEPWRSSVARANRVA